VDRERTAPVTKTSLDDTTKVSAHSAGVAVFGLVVLFGAYSWFIAAAPPLASLTLAVVTAIAWSVWLDGQQEEPLATDLPRQAPPADASSGRLSVHVLATSRKGRHETGAEIGQGADQRRRRGSTQCSRLE
jgi:MFS superfamily sulfate permease-like transporter